MILPILIETQDIVDQFSSLTKDDIENILDNIAKGLAAGYAMKLEEQAQRELKQTRKRYIQNIKVVDSGKLSGTVLLDYSKDPLIKMLEEGASAFDMKKGFMSSPKVKIGKNGKKYLTIPFRMGTPGAIGEEGVFSSIMPKGVYNVVKKKPLESPVSGGGKRSEGLKFNEIPDQFRVKKTRPAIFDKEGNELFKAYQHKTSIYEGLGKFQDSVTKQNTYRSFRRVSETSDPDMFIHPGIEKYNLIQKALTDYNVADEMTLLMDSELQKRGLI